MAKGVSDGKGQASPSFPLASPTYLCGQQGSDCRSVHVRAGLPGNLCFHECVCVQVYICVKCLPCASERLNAPSFAQCFPSRCAAPPFTCTQLDPLGMGEKGTS
jgi:hypothetical protein